MVRCGELCKSCGASCRDLLTPENPAELECTACDGTAKTRDSEVCKQCNGTGVFELTECPQKYVGSDMIYDLNIASACRDGVMPVSGGLMEQSAYWFDLWTTLESEQARIDRERMERHGRY